MQTDDNKKINVQKPVEDLKKMTKEELAIYLERVEKGEIDEIEKEEAKKAYLNQMVKNISRSNSQL